MSYKVIQIRLMSGPGYGSWNWTVINVNVWHYLLTKANNRKYCLNTSLGINWLQKLKEEKDIDVVIDSSLKFEIRHAHCSENKKGK